MEGIAELLQVAAMTLATSGSDGEPHAAPVYFAAVPEEGTDPPRWQLVFFSAADSRHARDLETNPRAAAAIYPETADWQAIHGLQLQGSVRALPAGPEWERAWLAYCQRFPFARQLQALVARTTLYAFTPTWVRLVDNRRGFGFREEIAW